jgi:hypothetical protein
MGSTCARKNPNVTPLQFFENEGYFNGENEKCKWSLVDHAQVGGCLYTVVDEVKKDGSETRRCLFVIKYDVKDGEICWKVIDEEAGPTASDCPIRLIKLMGPPRNESAERWRERCRDNDADKKARKKNSSLVVDGDVLVMSEPICFRDGQVFGEVEVVSWKSRIFKLGNSNFKISAAKLNGYGWSIKRPVEQVAVQAVSAPSTNDMFGHDHTWMLGESW